MSTQDPNYLPPQAPQGGGVTDVVSQLQAIVRQLGLWVQAFKGRITFGTFTLAAAATTTVNQAAVQSNSNISLTSTNAAAGTLMGSAKALYISAISPGVSFTVATANAAAAAGTETFSYTIQTPQ